MGRRACLSRPITENRFRAAAKQSGTKVNGPIMSVNYYEILEIPTDADIREIKRAYHRLARELHPDKAPTPEEASKVEERFALVSAAYNTLKDAQKRADYD